MAETWLNGDNLYIKFGKSEGAVTKGGFNSEADGIYRILEVDINYTDLTNTQAIMHDTLVIPKYSRIDKVETVAITAFTSAGSGMTLDLGLISHTDRTTALGNANGLVAALPQASMNPAGDYQTIDVNHTYKGSLIGTTVSVASGYLLTANWGTEAPTAGKVRVRVWYYQTQNR